MSQQTATTSNDGRLAITGIGVVSAAGAGARAFREALRAGRSCLGPVRRLQDARLAMAAGGSVPEEVFGAGPRAPGSDRVLFLCERAAGEALADAGIGPTACERTGIALGTALGAVEQLEALLQAESAGLLTPEEERARVRAIPPHDLAARLSARCGLRGPRSTFSVTCASGLCALEQAACDLRRGRAQAMLVGGADALSVFMQAGFCALKALSPSGVLRPLEGSGDGTILGEGAAFVALEPLRLARARGARIRGILAGSRLRSDAAHLTSPDESGAGMAEAISGALGEARVDPSEVAAVTVTAAGSAIYDRMQARAMARALGAAAERVPVTTWEASVGHALACTAILGLVNAVQTLAEGEVLPVPGPAPAGGGGALRYLAGKTARLEGRAVLALTVGFGGQNGASAVVAAEGSA